MKTHLDYIREIHEPSDYFHGKDDADFPVPRNILAFFRDKESQIKLKQVSNFHSRHILVINFHDPIEMFVDDSNIQLDSMEAILILPYQYHRYKRVEQNTNYLLLFISFDVQDNTFLEQFRNMKYPLEKTELLINFIEYYNEGKDEFLAFSLGLLITEILTNTPLYPKQRRYVNDGIVNEICRNLYKNKKLNIAALSETLNLSESYLRRVFKQKMNISLGRYIIETRLTEAVKLLLFSDKTITEISSLVGYESIYVFSRIFKKYFSIPPSEVRKNKGKGNKYLTSFINNMD